MVERWIFEVFVNGTVEAAGSAPTREAALAEAGHYTMMYGQDGGKVHAVVQLDEDNFEPPTVGNAERAMTNGKSDG